jgi:hypothetical protein
MSGTGSHAGSTVLADFPDGREEARGSRLGKLLGVMAVIMGGVGGVTQLTGSARTPSQHLPPRHISTWRMVDPRPPSSTGAQPPQDAVGSQTCGALVRWFRSPPGGRGNLWIASLIIREVKMRGSGFKKVTVFGPQRCGHQAQPLTGDS